MKIIFKVYITTVIVLLVSYSIIGSSENVDIIKEKAPMAMPERNWKIIRYEGYQYGSWSKHGGKVWYHVANIDNPNIQYRVYVTMWDNELQWYYKSPEKLERLEVNILNE